MLAILKYTCEELMSVGKMNEGHKRIEALSSLLSAYILLMDIFRFLLQACSTPIFFYHSKIALRTPAAIESVSDASPTALKEMSPFRTKELDFLQMMATLLNCITTNCPYQCTVRMSDDNRFNILCCPQEYVKWNAGSGQCISSVTYDKETEKVSIFSCIQYSINKKYL